jgi:hypothetical protein
MLTLGVETGVQAVVRIGIQVPAAGTALTGIGTTTRPASFRSFAGDTPAAVFSPTRLIPLLAGLIAARLTWLVALGIPVAALPARLIPIPRSALLPGLVALPGLAPLLSRLIPLLPGLIALLSGLIPLLARLVAGFAGLLSGGSLFSRFRGCRGLPGLIGGDLLPGLAG